MNKTMKNEFSSTFDKYVCIGDTITTEIDNFTITAQIELDHFYSIDDDDTHNIDQSVTGCNDEQQTKLLQARQAWIDNKWFYCGIFLSVNKNGIRLDDCAASLWGIEANYPGSDNSYLTEVANELLPEALKRAKEALKEILEALITTK